MSKKIYVGNLPFSATDDEIRTLFGEYGAVGSNRGRSVCCDSNT